ncbi:MAG: hypothetical protein ACRDTF_01370 [Pseudonocardiaceae bacterium]
MEVAVLDHIVHSSEARGVDPALSEVVRQLARRAIARGPRHRSRSRWRRILPRRRRAPPSNRLKRRPRRLPTQATHCTPRRAGTTPRQ